MIITIITIITINMNINIKINNTNNNNIAPPQLPTDWEIRMLKGHAHRNGNDGYSLQGGCSGRGVQWMGVVVYNKLEHNII